MTNCHKLKTATNLGVNLAYCEITQDDLNYIEKNSKIKVYYQNMCGYFYDTQIILDKLNTQKYPVFKAFKFLKPTDIILTKNSDLIIVAKIAESNQYFQNEVGYFNTIMEIENNKQNKTVFAKCSVQISSQDKESNLTCNLNITSSTTQYENLYLLPYSIIESNNPTFDIIIVKGIKAGTEIDPSPTPTPTPPPTKSSYLKYSLILLLSLILL